VGGRQTVAELDRRGHLAGGRFDTRVTANILRVQLRTALLADEHLDRCAGLFARHTDDRPLQHTRNGGHDIFQLVGVHVEAGDHDHVLLAVDNAHVAIFLDDRYITGTQPTLGIQYLVGGLGALPVALHRLGAFHAEFTTLTYAQLAAVV